LINFEETEVRVDCSKDEKIIVSKIIKEFYAISSENRKSVTIIEIINTADDHSFSFMIIIQKQKIMIN
jgi:hypothetical protein